MTVIQSASKWEFLMRLGLDPTNAEHQALYWLMKNEAIRGYNERLRGNRAALRPEHRDVAPPFAANQFTETAINDTIARIEANASDSTRPLYARGRSTTSPNWVIRWMLYHVCRYRDARNRKAQSRNFHDDDGLDGPPAGVEGAKPQKAFYDTARDGFRGGQKSR